MRRLPAEDSRPPTKILASVLAGGSFCFGGPGAFWEESSRGMLERETFLTWINNKYTRQGVCVCVCVTDVQ